MKKIIVLLVVFSLAISTSVVAMDRVAVTNPGGNIITVPEKVTNTAPPLEMIEIVHKKKAKPDRPGKQVKPSKEDISCYGFISGQAKLMEVENIVINPYGSLMNPEQVKNDFQYSLNVWQEQTSTTLFGNLTVDLTANFDTYADGVNEISFGDYGTSGTIAVTRIWGYFSGKPSARHITQFDMLFNTNYEWGTNDNPEIFIMDFKNIAIHEIGHTLGLNDMYETSCSEVTMFGYSGYGDIEKRSLATPDINGLQKLYGPVI